MYVLNGISKMNSTSVLIPSAQCHTLLDPSERGLVYRKGILAS